jgi:multidrug efflux system membrane fusion protein
LHAFVWLAVLLIFGVGFYLVVGRKEETKARPVIPITITTATAKIGDIGVYQEAIGTVTPVYTVSIFSQVTGVVTSVNYQEGQLVKKGDPLVDIDARQYEANLLQAQGALERDQNLLAQSRMDLERYQAAWARNAVAKQILDDQEKLVLQNEGTVKNDQGTVQFDQVQVDYCHIASPITGRVGLRLVDPGNLVTAGASASSSSNPLVVITQIQPITVIFTIPEDSLDPVQAQLRKGATLAVDVYDRAAQKILASGKLLALDNQIDTTTGTVKVRASFSNDDFALFPNQFVNTRLLVQTLQGVTLIPSAAIQQNAQTSFVYVIQDNVAHLRNVKPGVTDNGQTQVEGINPGDVVANSSFDKLQDNVKVTLASKPPAAPTHKPGSGGKGS